MNKNKFTSWLFVLLALLVVIGSVFVLISYATDVLNAVVDFITLNDMKELSKCGATLPPQFNTIKGDFTTLILPVLYYGIPLLLIVVSVLMFFAGFFYHKGRTQEDEKNRAEIEREMVRKAAERVVKQKAKQAEAAASKAMEEELEEPEEEPEMIVRKKRKKK
ncbi:MAG: hypothetical protein ACXAEU_23030 [Candidatus Hodarchaeales archaeon]|jgi:hypothetical protein